MNSVTKINTAAVSGIQSSLKDTNSVAAATIPGVVKNTVLNPPRQAVYSQRSGGGIPGIRIVSEVN